MWDSKTIWTSLMVLFGVACLSRAATKIVLYPYTKVNNRFEAWCNQLAIAFSSGAGVITFAYIVGAKLYVAYSFMLCLTGYMIVANGTDIARLWHLITHGEVTIYKRPVKKEE